MAEKRTDAYRHAELTRLLQPRSIAVVGASDRPGSLGQRTLANLRDFPGTVLPVNARLGEIDGHACYPSIGALPVVPDCAVIALRREAVEEALGECARRGVGAAVVFASGYAETGTEEGGAAQQRLSALARQTGMRIVGPNTTGLANLVTRAHAGFAEFPHVFADRSGAIALVTQSGALGLGLSQAGEHGTAISHVLTAGNSCDVDVADYLSFLAEEPVCRVAALVFEGVESTDRLATAARRFGAAGKQIVAFKLATSEAGRVAALCHTGSDAGDDAAYDTLFREAGIVRVRAVETLVETAVFFSKAAGLGPANPAAGVRAAILSSSGGTGIMAADEAAAQGIAMPQPEGETLAAIRAAIPDFGAARNPCDATAQATADPESLRRCTEAFLSDPAYDALVVPWGKAHGVPQITLLSEAGLRHGKPVCLIWMSQWLEGPGAREAEMLPGVSLFRSMASCFRALAAWGERARPID